MSSYSVSDNFNTFSLCWEAEDYTCCSCLFLVCLPILDLLLFIVVQSLSCVSLHPHGLQHTRLPCPPLSPGFCLNSRPLRQWYYPISYPPPPSSPFAFSLSQHQALFQWVVSSHRCPKFWSFRFSVNPSDEYLEPISFRIDWFDILAVQGTLKSLLQHHSLKTSILWCSAFFTSNCHTYTWLLEKNIDFTVYTLFDKMMSWPLNMLSKLVSFPSKEQVSFNFMAAVSVCSDFGAREKKNLSLFPIFPFYLPWSDGSRCHNLSFLHVEFQASFFVLLFHPHQEALQFLFTFCH